jgi:hypothetical protein
MEATQSEAIVSSAIPSIRFIGRLAIVIRQNKSPAGPCEVRFSIVPPKRHDWKRTPPISPRSRKGL